MLIAFDAPRAEAGLPMPAWLAVAVIVVPSVGAVLGVVIANWRRTRR